MGEGLGTRLKLGAVFFDLAKKRDLIRGLHALWIRTSGHIKYKLVTYLGAALVASVIYSPQGN